jgi:hypothetical protein
VLRILKVQYFYIQFLMTSYIIYSSIIFETQQLQNIWQLRVYSQRLEVDTDIKLKRGEYNILHTHTHTHTLTEIKHSVSQ